MHSTNQNKEEEIKRKVPLQSYNPCSSSSTTTTKPTPDVQFFERNTFKKRTPLRQEDATATRRPPRQEDATATRRPRLHRRCRLCQSSRRERRRLASNRHRALPAGRATPDSALAA